jgi:tetratricopeptide (TPR) repeat protein
MTPIRAFILSLLALLASTCPLLSQSSSLIEEPGDVFFRAYMLASDGDKLVKSEDYDRAIEKYSMAESVLDGLQRTNPTYQTEIVSSRKGKVRDALAEATALKKKAEFVPPPPPPQAAPIPQAGAASPSGLPATMGSLGPTTAAFQIPAGADPMDIAFAAAKQAIQQNNQQLMAKIGELSLSYEAATQRLNEYVDAYKTLTQTATEQQGRIAELEKVASDSPKLRAELQRLKAEKDTTDAQLADARARMTKAETVVMSQSKQLLESSDKLAALQHERDELLKQKTSTEAERDKATKQATGLQAKLEKANADLAAITTERDKMSTELLGLRAVTGKEPSAELKRLVAENDRLQKQVATLTTDLASRNTEIKTLRSDLTKLQGELTTLRQQNSAYETQVADLTVKIKEMNSGLAKTDPSKSDPELTAENQLLRSIVMRQLRQQTRQQAQNAAVIKEISGMENASKTLIAQVEALDDNGFTLSPEEQNLFTTPQLQEMLGGEGLQGTILAQIGNGKAGSSSEKTPAAASAEDAKKKALADHLGKGNEAVQANKHADAVKHYEDALRIDPKNADALLGMGWAQIQQDKNADAEVSMRKAIAHDPSNSMAHYMLGVSLFRRDRAADAQGPFEKSLELNNKNARARHYLGVIANQMNLPQRAEKEFKSALAIDPSYGEANFNLAVLYATWDPPKWDEAKTNYEEALKKGVSPNPELEKLLKSPTVPEAPKGKAEVKKTVAAP